MMQGIMHIKQMETHTVMTIKKVMRMKRNMEEMQIQLGI